MAEQILTIVSLVAIAGGTVAAFFRNREELRNEIAALRECNAAYATKVDLIWRAIEETVPKLLMKPTHLRMDELLEKYRTRTITDDEAGELQALLEDNLNEELEKRSDKAFFNDLLLRHIAYTKKEKEEQEKKKRRQSSRSWSLSLSWWSKLTGSEGDGGR